MAESCCAWPSYSGCGAARLIGDCLEQHDFPASHQSRSTTSATPVARTGVPAPRVWVTLGKFMTVLGNASHAWAPWETNNPDPTRRLTLSNRGLYVCPREDLNLSTITALHLVNNIWQRDVGPVVGRT